MVHLCRGTVACATVPCATVQNEVSPFPASIDASQEHLQGLRTQYRIRVEAMRSQVQQLTARHEVSKKELATSETVGERGEGGVSVVHGRCL